jgi:aminoglycoside 3-N-acetyltransferase
MTEDTTGDDTTRGTEARADGTGGQATDHDGERAAVATSDRPVTIDRLLADLRALGLTAGDDVLVHASLSALGWVPGGAPTVVDALMGTVTDAGTLVMPTHTGQYSDPEGWENPPVPEDWQPTIRETMPAYRPAVTPTRGVGAVPECFRSYPAVTRSDHPVVSFAAWGARAEFVVEGHELDRALGEGSPLARVYDLGGSVLLLGVGHDRNSSAHLAEYRVDAGETYETGAPVIVDGQRRWQTYEELRVDDGDFAALGAAFERAHPESVRRGQVGEATALLLDQVDLVDFAVDWLRANR